MERKKAAETLMRCTSTHCAFVPHWLMSFCQKAKPDWSGKRERKSMYCCWTKKSASSIVIGMFVPGRRRSGLTFVLPYIKSEGRRLPSSETMRSVGACWLCANADDAATARTKTATINLRILLLQSVTEPAGESATERPTGARCRFNPCPERGCCRHDQKGV